MTTYAIQGPPHAGAQVTLAAPGGVSGDLAPTGQGVGLLVVAGTAAVTVTLAGIPNFDGLAVTARAVAVAANQTWLIPLPSGVYGTAPTPVAYSNVTTVTVAVVTIP